MARLLLLLLLAYILSPIDIIPDFIPVLGLLDEAILVPVVLAIIYRLIPDVVTQDIKQQSIEAADERRLLTLGAILVVGLWLVMLVLCWWVLTGW